MIKINNLLIEHLNIHINIVDMYNDYPVLMLTMFSKRDIIRSHEIVLNSKLKFYEVPVNCLAFAIV